MAVNLSPLAGAGAQFFTDSGTPLTGGLLYTYLAGTTTPEATYTDLTGVNANPNPIVLNAAGRVPNEVWLLAGTSYKFVLKTATLTTIGTWDNIDGVNDVIASTSFYADTFTCTAGQTTFTLSDNPGSINNLTVSLDGAVLVAGTDFTWAGTTVVLTMAAYLNQVLRVAYSTAAGVKAISPGSVVDASVAVGTKLYNRINDIADVRDYGAVGNGVTDDTAAIQAAIDAASLAGKQLYMPAGVYKITAPLVSSRSIAIYGDGATSVLNCTALASLSTALTIQGSLSATATTLTAFPATNATTISVASTTGFSAGDLVQLVSTEAFSQSDTSYKCGELQFISSIGAGTITFTSPLKCFYTSGVVTLTKINAIDAPSVSNVKLVGPGSSTPSYGLRIFYAKTPIMRGVYLDAFEDQAISLQACDSGSVSKCHIENCAGIANQVGYAIGFDSLTQFSHCVDNTANKVSCGFSTGGYLPSWFNVVSNNTFYGASSQRPFVQTHINGAGTLICGNTLSGAYIGIGTFSRDCSVIGNIISNCSYAAIYTETDGAIGYQCIGNKGKNVARGVTSANYGGTVPTSVQILDNDFSCLGSAAGIVSGNKNTQIVRNKLRNVSPGVSYSGTGNADIDDNDIVDVRSASQAWGVFIAPGASGSTDINVRRNRIKNDQYSELDYGVVISANATGAVVCDNTIRDYLSAPISNSGLQTMMSSNNLNGDWQFAYVDTSAACTNGTTAGRARTTAAIYYQINGRYFTKNSTDNVWDLSAVSTTASEYMKVALCLDDNGTGYIVQGLKSTAQTTARIPKFIPFNWCPIAVVEIPNSYSGGSLSGFVFHNLVGVQAVK